MPSKRRLKQLKSARDASVQSFKKKKIEASQILMEPETDNELDTADTIDMESQSETCYWNESPAENDSDPEEEENYNVKERTGQSEAGQSEAEQSKARQLEARHSEAGQSEAEGLEIGQSKVEITCTAHHKPTNKDEDR